MKSVLDSVVLSAGKFTAYIQIVDDAGGIVDTMSVEYMGKPDELKTKVAARIKAIEEKHNERIEQARAEITQALSDLAKEAAS